MQKNGPIINNNEIMVQIFRNNSFNNLSVKDVTENNTFWKIIKLFFTDKTKNSNNISLTKNYQTMREDEKIFEICNTYFTNATKASKNR